MATLPQYSQSIANPKSGLAAREWYRFFQEMLKSIVTQATGVWTPADGSGAGLVFSSVSAGYAQIGNMVFAYASWSYPATADGSAAKISGLPVKAANANYAQVPAIVLASAAITGGLVLLPVKNTSTAKFNAGSPSGAVTNAQLGGSSVSMILSYPAA